MYKTLFLSLVLALALFSCRFDGTLGSPCLGTYECTPGLYCSKNSCIALTVSVCNKNSDCYEDYTCRFGLCQETKFLSQCTTAQDCGEGYQCKEGYCAFQNEGSLCKKTADCENQYVNMVCDLRNGKVCRPDNGGSFNNNCYLQTDCPANYACVNYVCVENTQIEKCRSTTDCDEGLVCLRGLCQYE